MFEPPLEQSAELPPLLRAQRTIKLQVKVKTFQTKDVSKHQFHVQPCLVKPAPRKVARCPFQERKNRPLWRRCRVDSAFSSCVNDFACETNLCNIAPASVRINGADKILPCLSNCFCNTMDHLRPFGRRDHSWIAYPKIEEEESDQRSNEPQDEHDRIAQRIADDTGHQR
jgi:hypothetical protein